METEKNFSAQRCEVTKKDLKKLNNKTTKKKKKKQH